MDPHQNKIKADEDAKAAAKAARAAALQQQQESTPGAVSVPATTAASRLDQRIAEKTLQGNNNGTSSSGNAASTELQQLEADVQAKQRSAAASVGASKPGAYASSSDAQSDHVLAKQRNEGGPARAELTSLEDKISSKIRSQDGNSNTKPGSAVAELTSLEDAVSNKVRRNGGDTNHAHSGAAPGTARAELTSLEDAVSSKVRRNDNAGATAVPGARAELTRLEDAVASKVTYGASSSSSPQASGTPGARAELSSLEDAVTAKVRGTSTYSVSSVTASSVATPGARSELSALEDAVASKATMTNAQQDDSLAVINSNATAMGKQQQPRSTVFRDIQVGGLDMRKVAPVPMDTTTNKNGEMLSNDDKGKGLMEQAPARYDKQDLDPHHGTTMDQGVVQEPDLEYGVYGGAGSGLAVAMPVEEEEDDAFIPSAVEFDPDAKPPMYRNRRFRLYAFLAFFVLVAAAVGAGVGIALTKEQEALDDAPTMAPTTYREGLGIREKAERVAGADELDNPDSPYAKALDWITYDDPLLMTPDNPNFLQRFVLAYMYHATSVDKPWKSCNPPKTNETSFCLFNKLVGIFPEFYQDVPWTRWLSEKPECEWAGVFCDDEQQVRALELNGAEMSGPFPVGLTHLPFIQSIALAWGGLRGPLPPEIVNMKHLLSLELHYNAFTGAIPVEWWQARSLVRINVGENNLEGSLPTEMSNLRDIKGLFLFQNMFEGQLPSELFELESLTYLRLSRNLLSGNIPADVGKLRGVEEIWLNRNEFIGSLPTEIGLLSNLKDLRVQYNPLTGPLPESLYNLTTVSRLDMYSCNFTGPLSPSVAKMTDLYSLRVNDNSLTGPIPSELAQLTDLGTIALDHNDFTGSMPVAICNNRDAETNLVELAADCLAGDDGSAAQVNCSTACCTACCNDASGVCLGPTAGSGDGE